jgi:excisionase family DNA binding protein
MATTHPVNRRRVTIAEAAAERGVSQRTIRRYIATGRLPAYRFGSTLIRIDPADLDRLERRIPAADGGPDAA